MIKLVPPFQGELIMIKKNTSLLTMLLIMPLCISLNGMSDTITTPHDQSMPTPEAENEIQQSLSTIKNDPLTHLDKDDALWKVTLIPQAPQLPIDHTQPSNSTPTSEPTALALIPQEHSNATLSQPGTPQNQIPIAPAQPKTKNSLTPEVKKELDFLVENKTGKTIYVTSFVYLKRHRFSRWRWHKSPVYKIEDKTLITIDIPSIEDDLDRDNTFGYLAVFNTFEEADDAIYELLPDKNKIDLDILVHLSGKKVTIEIEKYGKETFYEYDFTPTKPDEQKHIPELDFAVENKTGKTIHVVGFTFQKRAKGTWLAQKTKEVWSSEDDTRDDMSTWRFDKLPLITLKPGEKGIMDVDTIIEKRDRNEVQGYLAIYDEDELEEAQNAIYELLPEEKKITLGKLSAGVAQKKVVITIDQYGTLGDIIDFKIQKPTRIDFKKIK